MRLATTRGTNALLERRGARLVHLTTAGFEDLLAIGDQRRPDLFALRIERPAPLPEAIVGLSERLAADGSGGRASRRCRRCCHGRRAAPPRFDCASITLLHAQRNPRHEELVEALLRAAGFGYVARSSALSPFQGCSAAPRPPPPTPTWVRASPTTCARCATGSAPPAQRCT